MDAPILSAMLSAVGCWLTPVILMALTGYTWYKVVFSNTYPQWQTMVGVYRMCFCCYLYFQLSGRLEEEFEKVYLDIRPEDATLWSLNEHNISVIL